MINEKSIKAVKDASFSKNFCRPLYESYCFSNICKTVYSLFTDTPNGLPKDTLESGPYDHVILLFIDGFGWHFFEKYKSSIPILRELEKNGIASKITSMFPSTTAAHVTNINTDLTPNQSGLYEWFLYEPKLDDIIAPLPFCFAGEQKRGSLPLDPKDLYPTTTFYQTLQSDGIDSYAMQPQSIASSPYSKTVLKGANILGYNTAKEGLETILSHLNPKTYAYFYYGDVDAVGHRAGIHSKEFAEAIEKIFAEIAEFYAKLPSKTALIITADHGMTEVSPKDTYYLNRKVPNIEKYLLFGQRDKPLAPAGSCRDLFLHVLPERLNELIEILSHFLKGKAEVYPTEKLIKEGFFGLGQPSQNFLSRVGNLVILPYKGEAIWWHEKKRFAQNFYAAHGGLTREEMETLFLFTRT
ncbi:MAG: alkaline phosphatase family protein [Simkaniaceae bacterium]|nr:alkaline phosphatase family protein [Candidatus Sacchlamyda saccharinae]